MMAHIFRRENVLPREFTNGNKGKHDRTRIMIVFLRHVNDPLCRSHRSHRSQHTPRHPVCNGRRPDKRDAPNRARKQRLNGWNRLHRVQQIPAPDFRHPLHGPWNIGHFGINCRIHLHELNKGPQKDNRLTRHLALFRRHLPVHIQEHIKALRII